MSDWTAEQRLAIERRDGDLLLDAAAGSGKTSVLVERFVESVLADGIDLTAILAITFTEKAAGELRDRIRSRLIELGEPDQARRTEGAFISTIHGFCARVLRSGALACGLDPGFVVLDSDQAQPLAAAAFEDALARLHREREDAVELVAAYGLAPLREAILRVHGRLRSAGALRPRLPEIEAVGGARMAVGAAALVAAADVVAAELGSIGSPGPSVARALARAQECAELARGKWADGVWPPELARLTLPRNGAALATDACASYAAALTEFRRLCAVRAAAPVRDQMDRLLELFGELYEARKRASGGLDFEDLELLAAALLREDGEQRERWSARFARIMVDELQDTNRVQLELIEAVARENLFTVGDARQSIYGFRHADVELFVARGRRLDREGARLRLTANFRSRPEILRALNVAFGRLGEAFEPLTPGRAVPPVNEAAVELVLVDKGADWEREGVASPWRLAEARTMAARVSELVAAGRSPGEIVVLLRATTDMRAYERELESLGLPTYVIGGRGYWSHPQVVDLIAYLRALSNPHDEEALYGVLASPLAGVSLDAIVILAAEARELERDPWSVLRERIEVLDALDATDRSRLEAFRAWFAAERLVAARRGLEATIDAALELSGYDVAMLSLPGGRRRLANVRKLMRLAREHEALHGPDLPGFLEAIELRTAGTAAGHESEAPVEGEGLDAIRLMTIHRAKGLEFPVVVVADLGRPVRPSADVLRVSPDGRLGIRLARAGEAARESALDHGALSQEEREASEREERRLFYVAMTRAREHLVLSGAIRFAGLAGSGATGGGPLAWIAPAFVPELGELLSDGGDLGPGGVEIQRDGLRIGLRVATPGSGGSRASAGEPSSAVGALSSAAGGELSSAAERVTGPTSPGTRRSSSEAERRGGPILPGPPASSRPPARSAPSRPPAHSATASTPSAAQVRRGPPLPTLSYSALSDYRRCGYRFYASRVLGLPAAARRALAVPPPDDGTAEAPRGAADRGVLLHALLERLDFRRPVVPGLDAVRAAAARAGLGPAPGPAEADELAAAVRGFADSELCARLGRAGDAAREQRFAFAAADRILITGAFDVLAREPGGRALVVDFKSDRLGGASPEAVVLDVYPVQRLVYALAALRAGHVSVEVAHCFLERSSEPAVAVFERTAIGELRSRMDELTRGVLEWDFRVSPAPHRALCAGCPAEGGLCPWPPELTGRESPDTLF